MLQISLRLTKSFMECLWECLFLVQDRNVNNKLPIRLSYLLIYVLSNNYSQNLIAFKLFQA